MLDIQRMPMQNPAPFYFLSKHISQFNHIGCPCSSQEMHFFISNQPIFHDLLPI